MGSPHSDRSREPSAPDGSWGARLIHAVRRSRGARSLPRSADQDPAAFVCDVLDATSCLIIVIEVGSGVVAAMNQVALETTGFVRDEVVGRPLAPALMPVTPFSHAQALRSREAHESMGAPFEASLLTKSGAQRRVLWSSKLLTERPGGTPHVVFSGLDMSASSTRGGLVSHLLHASEGSCAMATDLAGRVTYWSDEAERLLGYSRQQMLGLTVPTTLFDARQLHERAAQLGIPADLRVLAAEPRVFERRTNSTLDLGALDRRRRSSDPSAPSTSEAQQVGPRGTLWTLIRSDGARVAVDATITVIRNASGEQVGFLGVGTDVTTQRRTHDLLVSALERESRAAQRLRELDETKDRLIATVSHELRTPLTSIDGYTELLEDELGGGLSAAQRRFVGAIRSNTHRLSQLVEDLLTLSGIETGVLQSGHEELDLRDAVSRAWADLELTSASRSLATSLQMPPDPVTVRGDAAYLARAISNLLTNSVKCTEDGGSVSCVLATDRHRATVRVTDTGFGIPTQEQASLFTRFFRTSTAQAREVQGSGLGLALAAAVVRSCSGEISVESEHLGGAVFTVDLPLADADGYTLRAAS